MYCWETVLCPQGLSGHLIFLHMDVQIFSRGSIFAGSSLLTYAVFVWSGYKMNTVEFFRNYKKLAMLAIKYVGKSKKIQQK